MRVVDNVEFTIFSPDQIRKMSSVKITVPDTYDEDGYPIQGGLADQRLGVIDPGLKCKSCGGRMKSCPGHFGHIELVRPVVHVGFGKTVYQLLKAVCRKCSRVMTSATDLPGVKRAAVCPHCGEKQIVIKFVKPTNFYEGERKLLPNETRERLERIPDSDLKQLGVAVRPEWMILTVLIVPPVNVRPSITLETGERSEDDLTHKLVDILRINQRLGENIDAGAPQLIIEDLWELLQYHAVTYFDNETAGIPPARHRSGRQLKTLFQRLKGKEGRFRYNLSGKRVNFSARTVISPDPTLSINQLGIPEEIASELTIPVKITLWNIDSIKDLIRSAPEKISYVIRPDGRRKKLTAANIEELLTELAAGYQIERQLIDGDLVVFNRQPSLHRVSMLCHAVKVLPGKTFRFNVADCNPYNADFDGDEMNIHVPQNEEAQSEAEMLMKVEGQLLSPRNSHTLIGPALDHLSGLYILTHLVNEISKAEAMELLSTSGIETTVKKKLTGKELYSVILPDAFNAEFTTKQKTKVVFKNGELVEGYVDSKVSNAVVREIFLKLGSSFARDYIDKATRLASTIVTRFGLSLSLEDYGLEPNSQKQVEDIAVEARKRVRILVKKYRTKALERKPGKTLKETLEEQVMDVLEAARSACNKIIIQGIYNCKVDIFGSIKQINPALMMSDAGARGSKLNVIQMASLVGQQAVRGKRPTSGYKSRLLPHFKRGDLSDQARGFVNRSFAQGLTPIQYFFHAAGGRDSVVDKGVNPAKTGYMQRRLVNALQDFVVQPGTSVRDAEGKIIQFTYGDDGLDITNGKKIAYGEPVGVTAAQSIGEPGTQMSVDYGQKVIIKEDGEIKIEKIGEYIDSIIGEIGSVKEGMHEICDLKGKEIYAPSLTAEEKIQWKRVSALSRHPSPEKLLKIVTRSGREIIATPFHSFVIRKDNKIVPVAGSTLRKGDRLPVLKNLSVSTSSANAALDIKPFIESSVKYLTAQNGMLYAYPRESSKALPQQMDLNESFGWLAGIYLSEGSATRHFFSISNTDEVILSKVRQFAEQYNLSHREYDNFRGFAHGHDINVSSTLLSQFLKATCGSGSANKRIPEFAYSASDEFVGALLRGCFDGDGNVNVERKVIRISSKSKELIDGIALLLTRFGIFASKKRDKKGSYWLAISHRYARVYLEKIGSDVEKKKEALQQLATMPSAETDYNLIDMIPGIGNSMRSAAEKLKIPTRLINNFTKRQKIGRSTLAKYVQTFEMLSQEKKIGLQELPLLKQAVESDAVWDEIAEIAYVEPTNKFVYDFTVPGSETFTVFDGIVTHNTLRTFHYAGVASLAQLGFTRLVEIVDARKAPKKPVMEVYLKSPFNKDYNKTKQMGAKIEQVTLTQVAEVKEDFERKAIQIKFNEDVMKEHAINLEDAVARIKAAVAYEGQGGKTITIKPKVDTLRNVRKITNKLREITLKGIPGISRAIIIEKEGGEFTLATEGSNLEEVFKIEEVDTRRTTTNDIAEIGRVLGIEAARNSIISELLKVLEAQDLDVDVRHIMLIADSMTSKGAIESVGRHGLAGKKASVLARAAFEETAKHLVNACVSGERDNLASVTENILIGQTIPLGTGMVDLEMEVE